MSKEVVITGTVVEPFSQGAIFYSYILLIYVMFYAIWYHLSILKNVKNTHGGVLLLVRLQASEIF